MTTASGVNAVPVGDAAVLLIVSTVVIVIVATSPFPECVCGSRSAKTLFFGIVPAAFVFFVIRIMNTGIDFPD